MHIRLYNLWPFPFEATLTGRGDRSSSRWPSSTRLQGLFGLTWCLAPHKVDGLVAMGRWCLEKFKGSHQKIGRWWGWKWNEMEWSGWKWMEILQEGTQKNWTLWKAKMFSTLKRQSINISSGESRIHACTAGQPGGGLIPYHLGIQIPMLHSFNKNIIGNSIKTTGNKKPVTILVATQKNWRKPSHHFHWMIFGLWPRWTARPSRCCSRWLRSITSSVWCVSRARLGQQNSQPIESHGKTKRSLTEELNVLIDCKIFFCFLRGFGWFEDVNLANLFKI